MLKSEEHIRHCMLYEYQLDHSARAKAQNICSSIGEGLLSHAKASRWFSRFDEGDYSLQDETKSGRPLEVDLEHLQALIKSDPRLTTRC